MRPYKRIERCIARYLGPRYHTAVEIGVGVNFEVADALSRQGCRVSCTDIHPGRSPSPTLPVFVDDIFRPTESIYLGADLLYAVRPGVEMVPALIDLACRIDADLLVYHLGNELYEGGGEVIECGVTLHRYHRRTGRGSTPQYGR
ncbi:MAG: hypothetical protein LUO93_08590 [Methanomicrobiales archaeon]|nr:hypothetical protein [Methanomicrobiales archaeon]